MKNASGCWHILIKVILWGIFFIIIAAGILIIYVLFAPKHSRSEGIAELNKIRADLLIAQKQWELHPISDYDIDVEVFIHMLPCPTHPGGTTLNVRQGQLVITEEIRLRELEQHCEISQLLPPQSFQWVRQRINNIDPEEDYLEIEFDTEYGFIKRYYVTGNSTGSTLNTTFKFSNFRPVPAPTPVPTISPAAQKPISVLAHIELNPKLSIRQIRDNVYVITHAFPWPANSLLVEMDNQELVLVGTPYTPAATEEVLSWIAARFGKRSIVAINTGYHVDNLGGNQALHEHGIPIYASETTASLLHEHGETARQTILDLLKGTPDEGYAQVHARIPYREPNRTFPIGAGLRLGFGQDEVQIYYPGPSQALDKVVVYFPRQKLLFGGCMILGGDQVGNTAEADMQAWPEAVRKLQAFTVEIVVPGHGERLDPGLIQHTLDVLKQP